MTQPNKPPTIDYRNPMQGEKRQTPRRPVLRWAIAVILFGMCWIGMFFPTSGRSRQTENRVKCGSNLRVIGQSIVLYANQNHGQLPPDLSALLAIEEMTPDVFCCPSHDFVKARGSTTQQVVADLLTGEHLSYAYVGGTTLYSLTSDDVVVFEVETCGSSGKGIHVLQGDGSVVFVDEKVAKAIWARYLAGVRPIKLSECDPAAKAATQPTSASN